MTLTTLLKLLTWTTSDTEWSGQIPITKRGNEYNCYLSSDIEAPFLYDELCEILVTAAKTDRIILHINSGGGYIDSAFKIVAAIKRSKATTVARLTGTIASAATIITLKCDEVEVEDYTHFMIHNYSTGAQGKGHEVLDYITFNDRDLKVTFKDIYSGFLSEEEIVDVIKGKDLWLNASEVRERLSTKTKGTK